MWLLCFAGCLWIDAQDVVDRRNATPVGDLDGDGVPSDQDCDDSDAAVGAAENWYADADGDGYGDGAKVIQTCAPDDELVLDNMDCDDMDGAVHPLADEHCNGGDDDCDGAVDEGELPADELSWSYVDEDADGFGAEATGEDRCLEGVDGFTETGGDCDDADPAAYPDADEACGQGDLDCDGSWDVCPPAGSIGLSDYALQLQGSSSAQLGQALWTVDLDADGVDDLAAGGPGLGGGLGGVALFFGPLTQDMDLAKADANVVRVYTGSTLDSDAGSALGSGDLIDGTGVVELVVGGGGAVGAPQAGWILEGAPLGGTLASRATPIPMPTGLDDAGSALVVADLDGDGFDDLVLGSVRGVVGDGGGFALLEGPVNDPIDSADFVVFGLNNGANLGSALAAGDLDGDGRSDLVVGGPGHDSSGGNGTVQVIVDVQLDGTVPEAVATIDGDAGEHMGGSLTVLTEGPGGWLIIGAPASPDSGAVVSDVGQVWTWPFSLGQHQLGSELSAVRGSQEGEEFGAALCAPGDLDGSFAPDVLIGLPGSDGGSGAVEYRGVGTMLANNPDATLAGFSGSAALGTSLACLGDVTGDGGPDLIVGAPVAELGNGLVLVYDGRQ